MLLPVARSSSQARTPGFHPGNKGSNPLQATTHNHVRHRACRQGKLSAQTCLPRSPVPFV